MDQLKNLKNEPPSGSWYGASKINAQAWPRLPGISTTLRWRCLWLPHKGCKGHKPQAFEGQIMSSLELKTSRRTFSNNFMRPLFQNSSFRQGGTTQDETPYKRETVAASSFFSLRQQMLNNWFMLKGIFATTLWGLDRPSINSLDSLQGLCSVTLGPIFTAWASKKSTALVQHRDPPLLWLLTVRLLISWCSVAATWCLLCSISDQVNHLIRVEDDLGHIWWHHGHVQ